MLIMTKALYVITMGGNLNTFFQPTPIYFSKQWAMAGIVKNPTHNIIHPGCVLKSPAHLWAPKVESVLKGASPLPPRLNAQPQGIWDPASPGPHTTQGK